eukprot:CAMPEP_0175065440 /NCGR_PEP_ID=MMETSP0052_2-20121109/15924_1 /TAXON_ID=51329 ORGANISM="Polytomella parva, Strain SAG 63-3" /NCGR_SAMPLE_ID=MMETSP0052_2 /ASSEMBLY_ACC=CAM_ASM_000194 /LENGTH=611 /DNA_ID=CAMNT_0016331971 /DNA_START=9 /DNA_END=1840 /DNA_ORIENTATION=+
MSGNNPSVSVSGTSNRSLQSSVSGKAQASLATSQPQYTTRPALMYTLEGPAIRTSRLRDHQRIQLAAGQIMNLIPTVDPEFQGYLDPSTGEAMVGVVMENFCEKVETGDEILLAEGAIRAVVEEVDLVKKRIKTRVNNKAKLRERRMVEVRGKFIWDYDAIKFISKNHMDFVSMPGIRSVADVQLLRDALDKANCSSVKILSHIDTSAAIRNYDEILDSSDGIVISRAYLGMRIPAEKVALAQKWMCTKANLKAKPIIIASQLLDTMVDAPRPTRAEMTDVANAMYDGADAIMLREETANGDFVNKAVVVASAILQHAEVGIDSYARFNFVRNFTPKPMATLESVCGSAIKAAIDMNACLVALVTNTSAPIRMLAKYRAPMTIVVVTTKPHVARQANMIFGTVPMLLPEEEGWTGRSLDQIRDAIVTFSRSHQLAEFSADTKDGDQLLVVTGPNTCTFATEEYLSELEFTTFVMGEEAANVQAHTGYVGEDTIAYRSTKVGLDLITNPIDTPRKTKLICTLGPKCWSEDGLAALIDAGMNIARFNFSHGTQADHQQVLDRLRGVISEKNARHIAVLLDTKGPEIRTAMLRDHKSIQIEAGQELTVVAVGER